MDDDNIRANNKIGDTSSEIIKEHNGFNSITDKRRELESIQHDLNELIIRISNFISDSQDFYDSEDVDECNVADGGGDGNGENQKENGNEKYGYVPVNDYYITNGINPPEINWNILVPYIQSIVSDLQKLRNLNIMTNDVIGRIRNVTGVTDTPMMDETELHSEEFDKDIDDKVEDENDSDNEVDIE